MKNLKNINQMVINYYFTNVFMHFKCLAFVFFLGGKSGKEAQKKETI